MNNERDAFISENAVDAKTRCASTISIDCMVILRIYSNSNGNLAYTI